METPVSEPQRLILKCSLSPGDIVVMTAAVRDLHAAYPGRFQIDVRTTAQEIWENSPHLTASARMTRSCGRSKCTAL